jgi:hypothetical protein
VVDLFGFSRGSATASYFLNRIQEKINSGDSRYQGINIRFVALFDQVPSRLNMTRTLSGAALNGAVAYTTGGLVGYNSYEQRCEESYGMKFTLPADMQIGVFLHLVALDEQRREFPVTDIQGALQVGFRGVHSDVGGGYPDNFFEYITRRFVYERGTREGVPFFHDKYKAMDPYSRMLYDNCCRLGRSADGWLTLSPTDNSALKWDDGEKRRLPDGLLLHPSVRWFKDAPRNSIKGYHHLP